MDRQLDSQVSQQVKVVPLAHPAAIQRGGWGREAFQVLHLKRVKQWVFDGRPCKPMDMTKAPPSANLSPTLTEIQQFLEDPRCQGQGITLDIEAAGPHFRCLGLMLCDDEEYICIHFRRQGGATYWPYGELLKIVAMLQLFLADPTIPKVMHNGQAYDVLQLEELGFEVGGYFEGGFDTLLAHRYAYGEAPADLQTLGIAYGGMSAWKRLVSEDDEGEGK